MTTTRSSHGPGGAHNASQNPILRAPRMIAVGAGGPGAAPGAGGTGQPDPNANGGQPVILSAPPVSQPPAPPPPAFTQEQVNSAAAAARRAAEAQAQARIDQLERDLAAARATGQPAPPAQGQAGNGQGNGAGNGHAPQPFDTAALIEQATRAGEFAAMLQVAIRERGLDADQVASIRALYQAQNPPNVTEWIGRTAAMFRTNTAAAAAINGAVGQGAQGGQAAQAGAGAGAGAAAAQAGQGQAPAPMTPGSISTAVPLERGSDILSMDPQQVHDLIRRAGGNPDRPYDPKNRAPRREIRRQFEDALRNRRIVLGGR